MTGIVLAAQLLVTVMMGVYFGYLLKSQKTTKTAFHQDNMKEMERLAALRKVHLTQPLSEKTRPSSLCDVIGQEDGIRALRAALCGKNPQHVLLYGSAGVGKTAAARVVLEEAKKSAGSPFGKDAKFIETDATTMRFDERSIADPLMGSVHDPIYQGAGAYGAAGIPQPKEGAVTKAHGGVLFIDEIGELHPTQMNRLLKVLEDRKVMLESAYYSPENMNIPTYIHDIFQKGLPADFRLIGATTRSPEDIPSALRSRCTEIYFNELSRQDLLQIARGAAQKLNCPAEEEVMEKTADYARNGRDCVNMIQRAASVMWLDGEQKLTRKQIDWVIESGKYTPKLSMTLRHGGRIGVVNGLAVAGSTGYVMEIEATAEENPSGQGRVTVTGIVETEQLNGRQQNLYKKSSARGSVDNALALLYNRFGFSRENYDIHINFPGGVPVDGPSAGISIFCALYSALTKQKIDGQVAMTGEITLSGRVLPVGGIAAKIKAAVAAGAHRIYVPQDNQSECWDKGAAQIVPLCSVEDVLEAMVCDPEVSAAIPASGGMIAASGLSCKKNSK